MLGFFFWLHFRVGAGVGVTIGDGSLAHKLGELWFLGYIVRSHQPGKDIAILSIMGTLPA